MLFKGTFQVKTFYASMIHIAFLQKQVEDGTDKPKNIIYASYSGFKDVYAHDTKMSSCLSRYMA